MLPVPQTTEPMESKAVAELPSGEGWQYEPKWDGFRCLVFRDGKKVCLRSRNQRLLNRYFPELVDGFAALPVKRFVLDGEIILIIDGHSSFEDLQMRLHPAASRVQKLAKATPASFVAFDMLVDPENHDLRSQPLKRRRAELEGFAERIGKQRFLQLSPAARSLKTAKDWLKKIGHGLDGIVAKQLDESYHPGQRVMLKYKLWKTVDGVVAGLYLDDNKAVEYLLLGLYDEDGLLHYVGRVKPKESEKEIRKILKPAMQGEGFTGRAPGGKSRWSNQERSYIPLKAKLVVEVSADHITGGHMRHGCRFLRWRPDKKPRSCHMEQIEPPNLTRRRMASA
ncbi:ATP-dependent DNA ligase [Dongia sp. agr-C8]